MIKFYIDEFGIESGGVFIQGNKAMYTFDEEETREAQIMFDEGDDLEDFADWKIHLLTAEQVETIKAEKILYEF